MLLKHDDAAKKSPSPPALSQPSPGRPQAPRLGPASMARQAARFRCSDPPMRQFGSDGGKRGAISALVVGDGKHTRSERRTLALSRQATSHRSQGGRGGLGLQAGVEAAVGAQAGHWWQWQGGWGEASAASSAATALHVSEARTPTAAAAGACRVRRLPAPRARSRSRRAQAGSPPPSPAPPLPQCAPARAAAWLPLTLPSAVSRAGLPAAAPAGAALAA